MLRIASRVSGVSFGGSDSRCSRSNWRLSSSDEPDVEVPVRPGLAAVSRAPVDPVGVVRVDVPVAGVVAEVQLADPRVAGERREDGEDRRGFEHGAEHGHVDVPRDHQAESDAPDLHRPPDLLE